MKLLGRPLSPYTRRVAISLRHYGMAYEQIPLAIVNPEHLAEIRRHNPLGRVPVLILDDGTALVESGAILDTLDEMAGPERALIPAKGPARRDMLQLLALLTGVMDRAVVAFNEDTRRPEDKRWPEYSQRMKDSAAAALDALDAKLTTAGGDWFAGGRLSQADITSVVLWEFMEVANIGLADADRFPALAAQAQKLGAQEMFAATSPKAQ